MSPFLNLIYLMYYEIQFMVDEINYAYIFDVVSIKRVIGISLISRLSCHHKSLDNYAQVY